MAAMATFVCPNDSEKFLKLWSINAEVTCPRCGVVWRSQMTPSGPKLTEDTGRREPPETAA